MYVTGTTGSTGVWYEPWVRPYTGYTVHRVEHQGDKNEIAVVRRRYWESSIMSKSTGMPRCLDDLDQRREADHSCNSKRKGENGELLNSTALSMKIHAKQLGD